MSKSMSMFLYAIFVVVMAITSESFYSNEVLPGGIVTDVFFAILLIPMAKLVNYGKGIDFTKAYNTFQYNLLAFLVDNSVTFYFYQNDKVEPELFWVKLGVWGAFVLFHAVGVYFDKKNKFAAADFE